MKSHPHDSAHTHVQGQSEYIDDRPPLAREVFLELFVSPIAYGKIKSLDLSKALEAPGVCGVYTATDFHHLNWGTIFQDQPLLALDQVNFVGEPIAIIAAETKHQAKLALEKIKIKLEPLEPILSVSAAKQKKAFIGPARSILRSTVNVAHPEHGIREAFHRAAHTLVGKLVIRGADHFYLESQACIAYPKEAGQIEIHSSSQHPTETQHVVAHALGLNFNDVVCVVKRMGGAFGGKESQAAPFAAYAALVAQKLKRPARLVLTKDDDMLITGKRNPFEIDYRVGFNTDKKITAVEINLFSDGGAYADLSTAIMERAMLHCDNAYYLPNIRITGQVCRTNYHPHTAFRGFGGPKGVAAIEKIIEEVAYHLKVDALEVRKANCYAESGPEAITPYGQILKNNFLPKLFNQLEQDSNYSKRKADITKHNASGANTLCGISMTAVKFGISFTTRFLNQANALVNIHRDGTIQVSTGATEMGQGVNTRIGQIIADEFGIPIQQVRVMTTSTEKNANTSPTAASSGTDINGAAALKAAKIIKGRLAQVAEHCFLLPESRWARHTAAPGTEQEFELAHDANSQKSLDHIEFKDSKVWNSRKGDNTNSPIPFATLCTEAYLSRISLCEYAHYKFPDLSFNKVTGKGDAFFYFTQGVAVSEVEVDRLTGEVKVRRVDILMDLGRPINEALDRGQIEGAFIQGMGWMTTEKLHYDSSGRLRSISPSTYKIPSVQDIPREFRVNLIENATNTKNVRSSKAVGEPPLLLSVSIWTAIMNALQNGALENSALEIPATQEQILRQLRPEFF